MATSSSQVHGRALNNTGEILRRLIRLITRRCKAAVPARGKRYFLTWASLTWLTCLTMIGPYAKTAYALPIGLVIWIVLVLFGLFLMLLFVPLADYR